MFFFFPDGIAPQGDIIIYQSDNDNMTTNVLFKDETFWMSQKEIALLFGVDRTVISKHLKNVFANQELDENSVCAKIAHTAEDGKTYQVIFYNLDAIIAVGYRVNSKEATRFRMWATDTLKEYIVKGFVLNDDMLKNGRQFGKDYFDELLARIKEIRASERRFYQKITDIFAQCSYDYDKDSIEAKQFYSTDVVIAKNYLLQEEISELNNIVSMFLDYAENQARRKNLMMMDDWSYRLDSFLQFNEYDILSNAGKISKKVADNLAKEEFKKYRIIQDREFKSDFDKLTASTMKKK